MSNVGAVVGAEHGKWIVVSSGYCSIVFHEMHFLYQSNTGLFFFFQFLNWIEQSVT